MQKTIRKIFSFVRKLQMNMLSYFASIKKRIHIIGSQCVNKQS